MNHLLFCLRRTPAPRLARRGLLWYGRAFVVLLGLVNLCGIKRANARVGNFCPSGTCDIATPTYVNVYWDSTLAQWDTDVVASSSQMRHDRVDALTRALVHSDYFSNLRQYDVVSAHFFGTLAAGNCGAPPATIDQAFDQVKDLANCLLLALPQLNSENTILNVFLPPQTVPSSPTADFCSKYGGQHDKYGSPVEITIIPTFGGDANHRSCNNNLNAMFTTLTHEMVEATTDPLPASITGWKNAFDGEIGDLCGGFTSFLYGQITQYWSNLQNRCVNGFSLFLSPSISQPSVCGTGKAMQFKLRGSNFGPKPWDLPSGASGNHTLYLKASISGANSWGAGDSQALTPETVNFGSIDWVEGNGQVDSIEIGGFDDNYGGALPSGVAKVSPGDTITFSVASQSIGQWGTVRIVAPNGSKVDHFAVDPIDHQLLFVNQQAKVSGVLKDTPGCIIDGGNVTFTASAGTFSSASSTTSDSGYFSTLYEAPSLPAYVTVGVPTPVPASISVTVHPSVTSLEPHIGSVAGGANAAIQGAGFVAGSTSVNVESWNAATPTAVAAQVQSVQYGDIKFVIPRSPLSGDGSGIACVAVLVNGIDTECLRYEYIVPGKPVLDFAWTGCGAGTVVAYVYAADGSPVQTQVKFTAAYNAFRDSTGNYTDSLTVPSGQLVYIMVRGPITATNAQTPALSVTQSFPDVPARLCGELWIIKGSIDPRLAAWKPDQFKPTPFPPCTGPECFGNELNKIVGWTRPGGGLGVDPQVAIAGTSMEAIMSKFAVRALGLSELRSYVLENPHVATRGGTPETQAKFIGPSISIAVVGRPPHAVEKLEEVCRLSFPLPPTGSRQSDYRILHLTTMGETTGWVEEAKHQLSARGLALTIDVRETGIYALARIVGASD